MPLSPSACQDPRWNDFLVQVRQLIDARNYAAWIAGLQPAEVTEHRVVAHASSPFVKRLIERRFLPLLQAAARASLGATADVAILSPPAAPRPALAAAAPQRDPAPADPARAAASACAESVPAASGLRLNPAYLFEHFVVGPSNELSHAACLRVVSAPALAYNPLYIHGPSGLGKTHLLQATCRSLIDADPHRRVLYLSCEEFTNRYIRALEHRELATFRSHMRELDCLAVDDIQFLSNKPRLQEEFFHTFNALYDARKQIILSSDSRPHDMAHFEERLLTRFGWGLLTAIGAPTLEMRQAIAERKARAWNRPLDPEIASYVAAVTPENIRELEGAVVKVLALADLCARRLDLDLAREALADLALNHRRLPGMADIAAEVARSFGVKTADLRSPARARAIAVPRQIAMRLMKELLPVSLKKIGSAFGGRDHSTVLHALRRTDALLEADPNLRSVYTRLLTSLQSGSDR
ncbi:MAG: chromosomal replication initiator protein DnaA [Planctomycetes bacterium]|nr:chromosomal replication initiator protein DnaA [Planctomycetota bacterium]